MSPQVTGFPRSVLLRGVIRPLRKNESYFLKRKQGLLFKISELALQKICVKRISA